MFDSIENVTKSKCVKNRNYTRKNIFEMIKIVKNKYTTKCRFSPMKLYNINLINYYYIAKKGFINEKNQLRDTFVHEAKLKLLQQ